MRTRVIEWVTSDPYKQQPIPEPDINDKKDCVYRNSKRKCRLNYIKDCNQCKDYYKREEIKK